MYDSRVSGEDMQPTVVYGQQNQLYHPRVIHGWRNKMWREQGLLNGFAKNGVRYMVVLIIPVIIIIF